MCFLRRSRVLADRYIFIYIEVGYVDPLYKCNVSLYSLSASHCKDWKCAAYVSQLPAQKLKSLKKQFAGSLLEAALSICDGMVMVRYSVCNGITMEIISHSVYSRFAFFPWYRMNRRNYSCLSLTRVNRIAVLERHQGQRTALINRQFKFINAIAPSPENEISLGGV